MKIAIETVTEQPLAVVLERVRHRDYRWMTDPTRVRR
jgi:hypothetical protein